MIPQLNRFCIYKHIPPITFLRSPTHKPPILLKSSSYAHSSGGSIAETWTISQHTCTETTDGPLTPDPFGEPVRTKDDWLRHIKEFLSVCTDGEACDIGCLSNPLG